MTKRDYYEILGVTKNTSESDIKSAYKKLAKKYHPDINKEKGAADKFKEVSEAYAVLSDAQKKAQYDQFGHTAFDQRFSQEDIFRDFDFNVFRDFGFGGRGFDSIFETFFGGRGRRQEQQGIDLRYDMKLTFEEAVFGVEKKIVLPLRRPCKTCKGQGSVDGKTMACSTCKGQGHIQQARRTAFGIFTQVSPCAVCHGKGVSISNPCKTCGGQKLERRQEEITVNIPAGVDNGTQIRLRSEGDMTPNLVAGDLYVVTHVLPHKHFTREDYDLYVDHPISFVHATLGATIDVPTLKETVSLKIPAGTPSHKVFRLKGLGVQHVNRSSKGDLYVTVIITVPEILSKKQRELLESFAKESKEKVSKKTRFFR